MSSQRLAAVGSSAPPRVEGEAVPPPWSDSDDTGSLQLIPDAAHGEGMTSFLRLRNLLVFFDVQRAAFAISRLPEIVEWLLLVLGG